MMMWRALKANTILAALRQPNKPGKGPSPVDKPAPVSTAKPAT